ncbi:MAG: hypothetical protein LBO65_03480 [Spirochaetaceae bacterium]|jgi:hypothetical protein|nr:hypothetical protein [Spirochaetaceae bacterium]
MAQKLKEFSMKKDVSLSAAGMTGAILAVAFLLIGCATTPSFDTLPESHPLAKDFVGTWTSNDAMVSVAYGSALSTKGQQRYIFYNDGRGEIYDFNGGVETNRRVFRYRISDTLIGFQFLNGTVFTNGGSFSRPYSFSPNKRQIIFPATKYGIGSFFEFRITTTNPLPDPPPSPAPKPKPINNTGDIFYSYDGTGYVYMDASVFYRCSDGKAVGYTQDGVIYAFSGRGLGFFDGSFIYKLDGDAIGAPDPRNLGLNAAEAKPVRKAGKQNLPEKGPRASVNKQRLRNRYWGGVLQDIFGR